MWSHVLSVPALHGPSVNHDVSLDPCLNILIEAAGAVGRQCLPQARERGNDEGALLCLQAGKCDRRAGHKNGTRDLVELHPKGCQSPDKRRTVSRGQLQWAKLRILPALLLGCWRGMSGESSKKMLISESIGDLFGIFGAIDNDRKAARRRSRSGHNMNVLGTQGSDTQDYSYAESDLDVYDGLGAHDELTASAY